MGFRRGPATSAESTGADYLKCSRGQGTKRPEPSRDSRSQLLPGKFGQARPSPPFLIWGLLTTEPDDIRIYMSFDNIKSQQSPRGAGREQVGERGMNSLF